jgi:leucyl-tRNA synthetase
LKGIVELQEMDDDAGLLVHLIHKTIKKVTEDIERFHLNTAIARIMELVNGIYRYIERERTQQKEKDLLRGSIEVVLHLLFPFVPHITTELWERLGKDIREIGSTWPGYNEKYVREEKVTIAVQINGKLRDICEVVRDIDEGLLKEIVFSRDKVKHYILDRQIKKTIIIPNRLINIVC